MHDFLYMGNTNLQSPLEETQAPIDPYLEEEQLMEEAAALKARRRLRLNRLGKLEYGCRLTTLQVQEALSGITEKYDKPINEIKTSLILLGDEYSELAEKIKVKVHEDWNFTVPLPHTENTKIPEQIADLEIQEPQPDDYMDNIMTIWKMQRSNDTYKALKQEFQGLHRALLSDTLGEQEKVKTLGQLTTCRNKIFALFSDIETSSLNQEIHNLYHIIAALNTGTQWDTLTKQKASLYNHQIKVLSQKIALIKFQNTPAPNQANIAKLEEEIKESEKITSDLLSQLQWVEKHEEEMILLGQRIRRLNENVMIFGAESGDTTLQTTDKKGGIIDESTTVEEISEPSIPLTPEEMRWNHYNRILDALEAQKSLEVTNGVKSGLYKRTILHVLERELHTLAESDIKISENEQVRRYFEFVQERDKLLIQLNNRTHAENKDRGYLSLDRKIYFYDTEITKMLAEAEKNKENPASHRIFSLRKGATSVDRDRSMIIRYYRSTANRGEVSDILQEIKIFLEKVRTHDSAFFRQLREILENETEQVSQERDNLTSITTLTSPSDNSKIIHKFVGEHSPIESHPKNMVIHYEEEPKPILALNPTIKSSDMTPISGQEQRIYRFTGHNGEGEPEEIPSVGGDTNGEKGESLGDPNSTKVEGQKKLLQILSQRQPSTSINITETELQTTLAINEQTEKISKPEPIIISETNAKITELEEEIREIETKIQDLDSKQVETVLFRLYSLQKEILKNKIHLEKLSLSGGDSTEVQKELKEQIKQEELLVREWKQNEDYKQYGETLDRFLEKERNTPVELIFAE